MNLRLLSLGAALAVSSLFFAACGGGDDDDSSSGADDEASSTSNNDDNDSNDGGGSVTGSGADALRDLAAKFADKSYIITYEFESESDDMKGSMTLGQKKPATLMRLKDGADDLVIIDDGKDSYFCSKSGSEPGSCLKSASAGDAAPFSLDDLFEDLDTDVKVTKTKDQKIAGRDAQCFLVEEEGQEDGTMCFDKKDGVLLSAETDDEGGFTLKATDVDTSPSDDDFKPPYKVETLGQ